MNTWLNLHRFVVPPLASPYPIEVNGVLLGTAVTHELGVRFVAVDQRVLPMDQSIWPSAIYAANSARQLFRSGPVHS